MLRVTSFCDLNYILLLFGTATKCSSKACSSCSMLGWVMMTTQVVGWVGSVKWWVELGWVTENGPTAMSVMPYYHKWILYLTVPKCLTSPCACKRPLPIAKTENNAFHMTDERWNFIHESIKVVFQRTFFISTNKRTAYVHVLQKL